MENTTQNYACYENNGQKEENLKIKNLLEKKLEELKFEEIENKLDTLKFDETTENLLGDINEKQLEKLVWDIAHLSDYYIDKIMCVNLKIINNNNFLYNTFFEIKNYKNISYDISWVNNPSNPYNPYVWDFYREIEEKYKNLFIRIFYYDNLKRLMNINMLNKAEQTKFHIINLYLRLNILKNQIEKMINFLECINYNYFDKTHR